jgi:SAM-dependent methyltransferase
MTEHIAMAPNAQHQLQEPSPWMVRFAHLVSQGGTLLDVACGYGRHARFFAQRGLRVTAVDKDAMAIASLGGLTRINAECRDLEGDARSPDAWPYEDNVFDAVVVCNYLWRPTFPRLLRSVRSTGVLLYETFLDGNERFGKPSRPEFLLRAGELSETVSTQFEIVAAFEGPITDSNGSVLAMKSMIAAVKR